MLQTRFTFWFGVTFHSWAKTCRRRTRCAELRRRTGWRCLRIHLEEMLGSVSTQVGERCSQESKCGIENMMVLHLAASHKNYSKVWAPFLLLVWTSTRKSSSSH